MPQRKCWFRMRRILEVFTTALVLSVATLSASTYKVLYRFKLKRHLDAKYCTCSSVTVPTDTSPSPALFLTPPEICTAQPARTAT
jgi:hypothetical protein